MESQNDQVAVKTIPFFNRPITRFGIFVLIGFLIWTYVTNIKPLMEAKDFCKNRVEYVPAKSSYTENGLFGNPDKEVPAVSEHYTWAGTKFESREKAEKACVKSNTK